MHGKDPLMKPSQSSMYLQSLLTGSVVKLNSMQSERFELVTITVLIVVIVFIPHYTAELF